MASLYVTASDAGGTLRIGDKEFRCALGKGGARLDKLEGDGATPIGTYMLRKVLYRPDRLAAPVTAGLPVEALSENDGWCDEVTCADYNRQVKLPHAGSHEELWRTDEVYDIIVTLGHNDNPPIPGMGSAIFMHVARPEYAPTAGCVALSKDDLLAVLSQCGQGSTIAIA